MKIKVKEKIFLEDALDRYGNEVHINDKKYVFMPYWFEFNGECIFAHSLENLPDELQKFLKEFRNNKVMPINIKDLNKNPMTTEESFKKKDNDN